MLIASTAVLKAELPDAESVNVAISKASVFAKPISVPALVIACAKDVKFVLIALSVSVSPRSNKASPLSNSALARPTAVFILPAAVVIAAKAVSTDASTLVTVSAISTTAAST